MDTAFLLLLILVGVALVVVIVIAIWGLISSLASSAPREVALDYEVPWKETSTLDYVAEHVSPVMQEAGYTTERAASELRYSGTHSRIWLIVVVILGFPWSLLFLLAAKLLAVAGGYHGPLFRKRDKLTIKVSPLELGSRVTVNGAMRRDARDQLTDLLAGIGRLRTPAGWYEAGAGNQRYWDGEEWTERTRRTIDQPVVFGPRMQHAQAKARGKTDE